LRIRNGEDNGVRAGRRDRAPRAVNLTGGGRAAGHGSATKANVGGRAGVDTIVRLRDVAQEWSGECTASDALAHERIADPASGGVAHGVHRTRHRRIPGVARVNRGTGIHATVGDSDATAGGW